VTAVTKQWPNDQERRTTRISCEPRKQLVSTQIQLSTGSASFLQSEARFAFRISEDYAGKKVNLIYASREAGPRTRYAILRYRFLRATKRRELLSFSIFNPESCLINARCEECDRRRGKYIRWSRLQRLTKYGTLVVPIYEFVFLRTFILNR